MRVVVLAVVTGCSFTNPAGPDASSAPPHDGSSIDIDAPADSGGSDALCFGSQTIDTTCIPTMPTGDMQRVGVIDTGTDASCIKVKVNNVDACVLATATFEVRGLPLVVRGAKPVVIIATTSITITSTGSIDAGGHGPMAGAGGLGAASAACTSGDALPKKAGGGWGGAGAGQGGDGGDEQDDQFNIVGDGASAPSALPAPTALHGGCTGGGTVADATAGGGGGGVLTLISPIVQIDGAISVSGGGGKGGAHHSNDGGGGGGGGAGGLAVIDSAMITGSGFVVAQGGGGGEGGDAGGSGDGRPGNDGYGTSSDGMGGNGGTSFGGLGGNGATGTRLTGTIGFAGSSNSGGGGGGGAAGFTFVFSPSVGAGVQFSPAHQ